MSWSSFSRPKPTVWTGSASAGSRLVVARSMPPELSAPSLSSTTAPIGRLAASLGDLFQSRRRAGWRGLGVQLLRAVDALQPAPARYRRTWNFFPRSFRPPFSVFSADRSRLDTPSSTAPCFVESSSDHGDDVLLRPQRRDAQRRLPEHQQKHGRDGRLQQPDRRRASAGRQSRRPRSATRRPQPPPG